MAYNGGKDYTMLTYNAFMNIINSYEWVIPLTEVNEDTALEFIHDGFGWRDYFNSIKEVATDHVRSMFTEVLAEPWALIYSYIDKMVDENTFNDVFEYIIDEDYYDELEHPTDWYDPNEVWQTNDQYNGSGHDYWDFF